MSLERRLSLGVALILALTLALGGWILFSDGRRNLGESEKDQIEATSLVFLTAMSQAESLTASHAELLAHDQKIAALLQSGDRTALQAAMQPVFDSLKIEAGVDVLHFHTADMKSYLRVWSPDDYGQDLSRIRPMILSANKSRLPQKGLEIGLKGLSLRAVSAIVDKDSVVGTIEVGVSLKSLMELAKSSTGADFAIFLDPQSIPDGKGGYAESSGPLRLNTSTDGRLFADMQAAGFVRMTREAASDVSKFGDRYLGMLSRPLLDYSGKVIGTLLVARDFTPAEAAFGATSVTVAVVSICGFLVAYGILMVILRSFVFRPIEHLAADCEKGETGDPVTSLTSYLRIRKALLDHSRVTAADAGAGSGGK